ncbi:MAG: hypothetical protein AB7P03_16840 [Kofleriaceae bacterium]
MVRSGRAFQAGDRDEGMALYQRGLREMDAAVELAPGNPGVRIPRGAVLFGMAPFVPEPAKSTLVRRAVDDYEVTLAAQQSYFGELTLHAREQLLYGLTDGFAMLGEPDKARRYFERMLVDAQGSELLSRAQARSVGKPVEGPTPCEHCHAR